MPFSVLHLDDAERVHMEGAVWWRPVRRALGATAFGPNAYTADEAGAEVIETHDEAGGGAGRHEEAYLVVTGEATFTIDDETIPARVGTVILVPVGTRRGAVAEQPDTTVLVIGGKPGAAMPASPFEYWYAAQNAYRAGDYERAVAIASEGLADWPEHPSLRYQLACYEALAGHREQAIEHLRVAFDGNPETRRWAAGDDDLASVRDDPALG